MYQRKSTHLPTMHWCAGAPKRNVRKIPPIPKPVSSGQSVVNTCFTLQVSFSFCCFLFCSQSEILITTLVVAILLLCFCFVLSAPSLVCSCQTPVAAPSGEDFISMFDHLHPSLRLFEMNRCRFPPVRSFSLQLETGNHEAC